MLPKKLIILGCGYIGTAFAQVAKANNIAITAIVRDQQQADRLHSLNIKVHINTSPQAIVDLISQHDALLDSIPLEKATSHATQCDWLPHIKSAIEHMQWVAYLSSSSVYGDHQGAWVNEETSCQPTSPRGKERLHAEQAWQKTFENIRIFRLSGIYGPKRNLLTRLKTGQYKALCWPHFSNRIHCDDIIDALMASLCKEQHASIINLSDDQPLSHHEYVCELAKIAQLPQPTLIPAAEANQHFSESYLDFFRDNKRICNKILHQELLPKLTYSSFRDAVPKLLLQ
ncbi:MAG: SDR family oxidoreductase [Mariprofundaceae bacterium]|nr:SDR family oxidoreductase [Mariprofundaceae bacterium]